MSGSSQLKYITPPTSSGSHPRSCETMANPAWGEDIGLSLKYFLPPDSKVFALGLTGIPQGPAERSAVMSRGVPS